MLRNIHLRHVDAKLMELLKHEASQHHVSVNTLILKFIKQGLGLSTEYRLQTYHDLDKFSGTWTSRDAKSFLKSIADFEKIDEIL